MEGVAKRGASEPMDALRSAWVAGNRLAPVLVLVWGVPFVLYLVLSKFGQAQDLMRVVGEDLLRNFFFTMALALFTISGWVMIARAMEEVPDLVRVVAATVLSAVGPVIIGFAYQAPGTIGELLVRVCGIAVPAGSMAFLMLPANRETISVERAIRLYAAIFAVLSVATYLIIFLWPDFLGLFLGPVTVLLIVFVALMWAVWLGARLAPLIGIAALGLIMFAMLSGWFGTREVQTLDGGIARLDADAYKRAWIGSHQGVRPVIISSDGGGIRAAYWTAIVLSALTHDSPGFVTKIYGASGVSGGSVGLAEFASVPDEQKGREALSFDYLAVPLTRLLTRDPLDSVACFGWGWAQLCSGTDRQRRAEWIFEATTPRLQKAVEQPLLSFALALNATDADTGEPLIISNVATGGKEDLLAHLKPGKTLRLSTAMLLSARFPVISPVGEIALDGKRVRIVDGGYFDNSGGATASRMAREVGTLRPIGIMMTNDDARARGRFCAAPKDPPSRGAGLAEIFVTPVGTLDAGRANAAELRRREFRSTVEQIGGEMIEIPLFRCAEDGDPEFPLGWSISGVVREHMDKKLTRLRGNETGPYRELVRLLN